MAGPAETPELVSPTTETSHEIQQPSDGPDEDRLADLIAQATALYAVKDYSPAAELYSQATELQAEANGEMATQNADLLYSYGKCLYFVAVRNSEVLGVGSAGAKLGNKGGQTHTKQSKKRKFNGGVPTGAHQVSDAKLEPGPADITASSNIPTEDPDSAPSENDTSKSNDKPYFQISGDAEDWDDSDSEDADDEEAENGEGGADEDDQDDFSLAFEVLDLARVLLLRKLDDLQQSALESADKGKYVASIDLTPAVHEVKERIADVHDLQAEISLEGERYSNAIQDLQSSLALKEELYPFESNYVAECHYKLSLALEFGSKTQQRDADGNPIGEPQIDQTMLAASIAEMEQAIGSCERRIKKEQVEVDNLSPGEKKDRAMRDIDEVREIVDEMNTRLTDLRADPVDAVQEANRQAQLDDVAGGSLLKEMLGTGDKDAARRMLDVATAQAKDLGGLVKRKKKSSAHPQNTAVTDATADTSGTATPELLVGSNGGMRNGTTTTTTKTSLGKRKVGFVDDVKSDIVDGDGLRSSGAVSVPEKRARVEDTEDSGL